MLISVAASLAVAIIAAAVGRILMGDTASAGTYFGTTADVITALAVVILYGISFVGITGYLKSHTIDEEVKLDLELPKG